MVTIGVHRAIVVLVALAGSIANTLAQASPAVESDPRSPHASAAGMIVSAGPAGTEAGCHWRAPVTAAVSDPFRAPPGPYGPGNRGLEYATAGGEAVVAAAEGRVSFAGPVAGRRYVVVSLDHGLRATYGPLATVGVVVDQPVGAGQAVGTADSHLLFTVRAGDRYVDPAPFLAGRCGRPRLVPT